MRRVILSKLYDHLEREYTINVPRETFLERSLLHHELEALLAFKSDPLIDEMCSALGRLHEGTYGTCLTCKRPIEQQLLDSDPVRRVCGVCEQVYTHHNDPLPLVVSFPER